MAAGAADRVEVLADELAGVARVAEVADRDHQRVVDDAGDDRPLHVLELQVEIGDVGDEVLARQVAQEGAEHLLLQPALLARHQHVVQPLGGDLRAFHLANHGGVGQRIQIRERLDVHPVRVAVEEQRVRLDRVEHRGRDALGDVHVHGAQVLGQDGGGRAVVGADVLVDRGVAGLLGVMVDHQVHAVDLAREIVRLHVHHRHAVEVGQVGGRDDLDLDVEQAHHPQVLGPGHAVERRDHRRLAGAAQHRPQGQPAGHGIRVRVVVQEDDHLVGVAEEALVLLHPQPRQRSAELGEQRAAEQLGQRQVVQLRELRLEILLALPRVRRADAQDVDQRGAGVPDGFEDALEAVPAVVLDDHAGAGGEVGLDVGVGAARVARRDVQPAVVEPLGQRLTLDQELDFEVG